MPRTIVTPELADTLRMIRVQNNITAKKLSEHINKSPSYITKLEKGYIKSVDSELIDSILQFVTKDDSDGDKLVEEVFSTLKHRYSKEEIDQQVWFTNYDTVLRKIPVPVSLLDFINERITNSNIEIEYLLSRINANEALPDEDIQDDSIEYNVWYASKACNGTQSIKIKMNHEDISALLSGKQSSAPYYVILTIVFYILKIEKYDNYVRLNDSDYKELFDKTKEILNSFKFYSLVEKEAIIAKAESDEQLSKLLNSFDYDNQKLISEVLLHIKVASDYDIKLTNERLKLFLSNVEWDLWFTLKLISLDYYRLNDIDIELKRSLLLDIERLIDSYFDKESISIETY